MRVDFNNNVPRTNNVIRANSNVSYLKSLEHDKFELVSKTNYKPDYKVFKNGKVINFVSFKALQDPTVIKNPSIRAGVCDSAKYQENIELSRGFDKGTDLSIKIVKTNTLDIVQDLDRTVEISLPNGEVLGHLPNSINNAIGNFIQKNPSDFSFKLSETTIANKKHPANALMDIEYLGENKPEVQKKLNSLLYKNVVSPEQVLHRILDYKKVLNGGMIADRKINESQTAIDTITKVITNTKNQKILLIGHNNPDGDTVGSCVGLKAALDYMGKEKVDIAIDDFLTGFLRNFVGNSEIKKSPEFMNELNSGISQKIEILRKGGVTKGEANEIYALDKVRDYYNDNIKTLNKNEKYDIVIFLDVPTPTKVSPAIKEYVKNAKNVIYIDHHPFRNADWSREQKNNGIDMDDIKRKHLSWIENKVPANTMLVTILIDKLLPGLTDKFRDKYYKIDDTGEDRNLIQKMATSLVIGTMTDTGTYKRKMNKNIEDEKLPSELKTGFAPKGLSDWLLSLTNGEVTRRSIKNKMKYDLPNKVDFYFPEDPVEFYDTDTEKNEDDPLVNQAPIDIAKVIEHNTDSNFEKITEETAKNTNIIPELGLSITKVYFKPLSNYLKEYNTNSPEVNLRDIIATYKYNPASLASKYSDVKNSPYKYKMIPKYDNNRITVMIREEAIAGELNVNYHMQKKGSLGFSFRSADGTNYAGILATLFGGGGHAAASGATLSLPGLTPESKIVVKINGRVENDINTIYRVAKQNYNNEYLNNEDDNAKIDIEISENGLKIEDLLTELTREIRQNK